MNEIRASYITSRKLLEYDRTRVMIDRSNVVRAQRVMRAQGSMTSDN